MGTEKEHLISMEDINTARSRLISSGHFIRTPMLTGIQKHYGIDEELKLNIKLEMLQVTGSFKMRGVYNQMTLVADELKGQRAHLVSASAGNYGKAYAYMAQNLGLEATLVMADSAPRNRMGVIQGYGVKVLLRDSQELQSTMDQFVKERGWHFVSPFGDRRLFAGYGSCGLEILEDVPEVDVVVVCCGTGALVAGIAAGIKLSGRKDCRVYGVEPTGACTMHESFRVGKAVGMKTHSIAAGLAPPMAVDVTYQHCREFVDDILLVTDEEIIDATLHLFDRGLKVEPSGAAAFAAVKFHKVPDLVGKNVVVVATGGNITIEELSELSSKNKAS